ncbi:MAG: 1-deoxy-D-xylulose-5-phosphate reductoisomerase, partial [Eubacterium sp.]|nr:1-deoxy-D-xylulose-5-phosphate reductoisomerase [Eubacterium sp.]
FLDGKIKFTDIAYLNNDAMKNAPEVQDFTLSDVLETDRAAREFVLETVK